MGPVMLLLLAAMSGAALSPSLIQMFVNQRKDAHKKWGVLLNEAQEVIVAIFFWLRGVQTFVDAAGKPTFSNEAQINATQQFQKDFLAQTFVGKLIGGLTRSILALLEPSAAEEALMSALLSGKMGLGGGGGGNTNVVVQAPPAGPPAPRTAEQVLRSGPRAQGVYINANGDVVAY